MAEFLVPFVANSLGRSSPYLLDGIAAAHAGRHKEAIARLDAAVASEPNAETFFLRARSKAATGDSGGAREDFTAAIVRAPRNPMFRLARATLLKLTGDIDGEKVDVRAAYQVQPASPLIQERMAELGLEAEMTAPVPRIRRSP
jgi:Flp pilus assembly protein TadD